MVARAKHKTALAGADNPAKPISKSRWNEDHPIIADTPNTVLAFDDTGTGVEITHDQLADRAAPYFFERIKRLTPWMIDQSAQSYNTAADAQAGVDQGAIINAVLSAWKADPSASWEFGGAYWPTTVPIIIDDPFGSVGGQGRPVDAPIAGFFVAKPGSVGDALVTVNWLNGFIQSPLGAYGTGSTTYSSRGWRTGIRIVNSNGLRMPDGWYAHNFKRWGLETSLFLLDGVTGGGNNIGLNIGGGKTVNCGSASNQTNGSQVAYTYDSIQLVGGQGQIVQTSIFHFTTALDPYLSQHDPFVYTDGLGNRHALFAKSIDLVANTITFYYWPRGLGLTYAAGTYAVGGTLTGSWGGTLLVTGSNTSNCVFGPISCQRSGCAYTDRGLYGSLIKDVSTEVTGINHIIGSGANNQCAGTRIMGGHSESTFIDEIIMPGATDWFVGPFRAKGAQTQSKRNQLGQSYRPGPIITAGYVHPTFRRANAGGFQDEFGNLITDRAYAGGAEGVSTIITLSNRPDQDNLRQFFSGGQNVTVQLDWLQEYSDYKPGYNAYTAILMGTGANHNISQLTLQILPALLAQTPGFTINGGAGPIVKSGITNPIMLIVTKDARGNNLDVAVIPLPAPL